MTVDIRPFQNILTPSPIKEESALEGFLRTAEQYKIKPDQSTLGIFAAADAFRGPKTPGYSDPGGLKEQLKDWEEAQKRQADYRQQLGEQSTKKALMYSTIARLPKEMANAFSPYGGQTGALMAYEGMSKIPEIYRSTLASAPQMNISVPGYSAQQPRYFS